MCFGTPQRPGGRTLTNRRDIKRMEQLGYDTRSPYRGRHPLDGSNIRLYSVRDYFDNNIATLAATEDGLL